MKLYSGIDLHPNNSVIVIMDDAAHVMYSNRVANDIDVIVKSRSPYKNDLIGIVIEAANYSIRFYPEVKRFYQRKLSKRGRLVAIKSVAHKLSRSCYCELKNGTDFDMNLVFK